ncbi:MAG: NAD(P)/FAD-dependent oxidoreductase [Lachnospiraceae bacterium]|nr:NAD(P)/FAD-dependent oxidoreductase [Lachnospiraceae bacterium]
MSKVVVIGGGAAGMMAAIAAAECGHQVTLYEKNEKLGKKIFITGKGRCNVTNACDTEDFFASVMSNPKFLYSAVYGFDNHQTYTFFEEAGCPLKIERGDRVFPVSDHSSDVIKALQKKMERLGVAVVLNTEVKALLTETMSETSETQEARVEENTADSVKKKKKQCRITGLKLDNGKEEKADAVIVATGGISYESTGSTGDGYRFAEETGHNMVETKPSLVPLNCKEAFCKELMGLSLKNVEVTLNYKGKEIFREFGEMLFTHFGVSGPLILSASCKYVQKAYKEQAELFIDLKPALSEEQLDKRILRDFEDNKNKAFRNALGGLFPTKLIPVMINLSGINPDKKVHEITKEERKAFVTLIKKLPITVTGCRNYNEAIITKGGVAVKDVNPSTMESKRVKGLYFAGEVLDLDAVTGGFNLQIAWSTGHLAGSSIE